MFALDTQTGFSARSRVMPVGTKLTVAPGVELAAFTAAFGRDEEIFGEGEAAEYVYKVLSGVARSYRVLDDGRRQISAFHFPGDIFGLEPGDEHGCAAEAVTACEVALVKRAALERAASESSQAASSLWALTSQQLNRAQAHILLLGRKTARERVASFLIDLADRAPGHERVAIPMSRSDIADYLGLTIETVSRTITQLTRAGAIALCDSRNMVLQDRTALDALAA